MKRRMIAAATCAVMALVSLAGCAAGERKAPKSVELTKENLLEVVKLLEESGLSHIDVFEDWVSGPESDPGEESGFSDPDCRMTAFLLAGDQIGYDRTEKGYDGTYLMFDLSLIEEDEQFRILSERLDLFVTLFGEREIGERGFEKVLPDNWKEHGLRVENERCSLISILFKAYEEEKAFVGHTGLLVDLEGSGTGWNYLFVEKIAFSEPYLVTWVDNPEDLIEVFSSRPDYAGEEGDQTPLVFRNEELIGKLDVNP